MSTFYDVLGLAVSAEPADVRAAFFRLAKSSHPDVNVNDGTAEERFKKLNQAYEILSDPERRAAYDLGLKHKLTANQRHFRSAIIASAACFAVTVACGLYFSLPYVGREAVDPLKTIPIPIAIAAGQELSTSAAIEREKAMAAIGGSAASFSTSVHRPEGAHALKLDIHPAATAAEEHVKALAATVSSSSITVAPTDHGNAAQPAMAPQATGPVVAPSAAEIEKTIVSTAAPGPPPAAPMPQGGREQVSQPAAGLRAEEGFAAPNADPAKRAVTIEASEPSLPVSSTEHEQALHLYAMGMERIDRGDVIAARSLFLLAAKKGSVQSIRALAGTYDPAQLAKLKVLGMTSNLGAAREWYQKVGDSDAIAAAEQAARDEAVNTIDKASKPETELAQFRAAYLAGEGLAYVIINADAGDRIYRYGDVSRSAATKDAQAYTLFTCETAHVFALQKAEDLAALKKASVVRRGDVRFSELDAKYLSSCNDPLIKSAIPKIATVREDH